MRLLAPLLAPLRHASVAQMGVLLQRAVGTAASSQQLPWSKLMQAAITPAVAAHLHDKVGAGAGTTVRRQAMLGAKGSLGGRGVSTND